MSVGNAVALGFVEGLTEFLPVSRTGHLAILNNLFSLAMPQGEHLLFSALLRLAALFSLCVVYWSEITGMFREGAALLSGASGAQRRYPLARQLLMLLAAALPMLLVLPFRSGMARLQSNSFYIGAALVLNGFMLYVAGKMLPGKKTVAGITISDALLIGLAMLVGCFPGFSRVGAALACGFAAGLERSYSAKFALLASIPALFVGFLSELVASFGAAVDWHSLPAYLVGTAVAVLAGAAAVLILRAAAGKAKLSGFAYYCWVAGVLSVILKLIF